MKNTLFEINEGVRNNPQEFVLKAEQDYIKEIYEIAEKISNDDAIKIVSIAGPSASGKTTTAHILCERLREMGEHTVVVSLDDFYLPTEQLPVLPDGKRDIESVNALDIELIGKCFNEIISVGSTTLPHYDFMKKERTVAAKKIDIQNHGIVIVEGLHAINPLITDLVSRSNIFKIYISVNCSVLDENGRKILSSRQIRLARRALRDEIFRNTSIENTLILWEDVVAGEEKYLYKFKDTADVQLKTLHVYEPCLYRNRFIEMKNELTDKSHYYDYFMKTQEALSRFVSLDESFVPKGSLIREFIGFGKYN